MRIQFPLAAGWYHAVLLTALPWVVWWRPWWGPVVAAAALALHRKALRSRAAEPWASLAVALSALVLVVVRGGWDIGLGWLLLALLVAAAARYSPRRDGSRPDAADFLAVGGWAVVFVLAPRLVELAHGGWLAPALLLFAAQRAARSKEPGAEPDRPAPPSREVRGTFGLDQVVVGGEDRLPRSVPLDLELRAGDSLAILCDAPAEAGVLAEVLAGRRPPLSGRVSVDGSPMRGSDRLAALVAPGEPFIAGDLHRNLGALSHTAIDRRSLAALREACSLTEVAEQLGDRELEADGEPLTVYHRMLVQVARAIPSAYRVLVVVDPMPWVNAVRGEIWRRAVVRASVGRTSIWITADRHLAEHADRVMEYRGGALRWVEDQKN